MVKAKDALRLIFRPSELRSIIQWSVWHEPVHTRNKAEESESVQKCFYFLEQTSRSFSTVIMELHPELLVPICLFYLVLRGLDTIEDDTSIPFKVKEPLLRGFDDILDKDGWTFDGNRPEEKDRELLVQFHYVITEFKKIKPAYRTIIKDIAKKMGNGMADYCERAENNAANVETIEDYDLYCYYVAGLVGEGLTRLFVEAGCARPQLLERPELFKSMGLFLQKTNIIRDVREDHYDNRHFWPKEIWSKHVDRFDDLFKPEHRQAALNCNAEMILNALSHVDDCIFYLAGLTEQSIFNFAAIPQSMAIATLELCFRNGGVFERNIKITKGDACRLMLDSTQNVRVVCEVFRRYCRAIHKKNSPKDPNFLKISVACGKVEKFIESILPSQTPEHAKRIVKKEKTAEEIKMMEEAAEARKDTFIMMGLTMGLLLVITIMMFGTAWCLGARFDLAYQELKNGNYRPRAAAKLREQAARAEL